MIRLFLNAIWDGRPKFGEIRSIKDGRVQQHFLPTDVDGGELAQPTCFRMAAQGWDVYYGVLPRLRASGTKDDVEPVTPVLWADVDAKKASDVLADGKRIALERINAFLIPPQILVDSGGGYHCYWRLTKPEPLLRAQEVMRWIADELSGDRVQDGPRVLRVPGTINYKREPAVEARLLRFDLNRRYRLADLEGLVPVPDANVTRHVTTTQLPRLHQDLPDWLVDLVHRGAPAGTRSETCFRVMVWLLRYGRSPEEVKTLFRSTPQGIGEKYDQKSQFDAERWLDYTLTAADRVA